MRGLRKARLTLTRRYIVYKAYVICLTEGIRNLYYLYLCLFKTIMHIVGDIASLG